MSGFSWGETLDEPETPKAEDPSNPAPAAAKPVPKAAGGLGAALSGIKKQAADDIAAVAKTLENTDVEQTDSAETDEAAPLKAYVGLHPGDKDAEVVISGGKKGTDPGIYKAAKSFEELGLSKDLLDGVYGMKFTHPSKIQAQSLPVILSPDRPNLIGQAHHGSGKTASYSLGMLSRVDENKEVCQAICVCPVRELARQVHEVITTLGKFTKIKSSLAVPGADRVTKVTTQIVVGTPGTILAYFRRRAIDSKNIVLFVADEADQMIDRQGLGEQTIKIKNQLKKECQILLFSATFAEKVAKFANVVAKNATKITIKREDLSLDAIQQFYMDCKSAENKYEVLTNIYGLLNIGQSIIFVHTVKTAKDLTNKMREDGYTVSLLHGKDMEPEERDKVMDDFRTGNTTVLITTNVLARGIDILQVTLVINYDIPLTRNGKPDPETYIHRIGRSGRFGRKGVAINLVYDDKSKSDLRYIAQYYNKDIAQLPTEVSEELETKIKNALGR